MSNIVSFVFKGSDRLSAPLNKISVKARALMRVLIKLKALMGRLSTSMSVFASAASNVAVPMGRATTSIRRLTSATNSAIVPLGEASASIQGLNTDMSALTSGTNALSDSLDNLEHPTTAATQNIGGFSQSLGSLGSRVRDVGRDLFAKLTLPITIAGGFLIKAASDAEETSQKFGVVFKDVSKQADKVASDLSKNFGLSGDASKQLLADTGDLLSGFGFTGQAALDMSKQVQELAVDLASFTNIEGGTDRASAALTSALLGEREAVKSLGIAILEDDVKRRVQILLSKGQQFASLRQAKAFATLQLAQEQSKNAIGDFNRSQKSFANQTRIAQAAISDMAGEIGKVLLPFATKAASSIAKLAKKITGLSPSTKKIALILAGLAAILPPLLILVGGLAIAFSVLTFPILLITIAVAGLVAAGIFLALNWEKVKTKFNSIVNSMVDSFKFFKSFVGLVIGNLKGEFDGFASNTSAFGISIKDALGGAGGIAGELSSLFINANKELFKFFKSFAVEIIKIGKTIFSKLISPFDELTSFFSRFKGEVSDVGAEIKKATVEPLGISSFIDRVIPSIAEVRQSMAPTQDFSGMPNVTPIRPINNPGNQHSVTDVNVNMNAPKGAVSGIDSSTRGAVKGMNLGVNMVTTP